MGKKSRDKNRKKRANKKQSRKALANWQKDRDIHNFADNLKKNLPKSEQWFLRLFKKENIKISLESNPVIGYYIPDFVYKNLVIEIDDPTHKKLEQIKKDKLKDIFYKRRGYKVIRIIGWDQTSYIQGIKQIKTFINKNRVKSGGQPKTDTFRAKQKEFEKKCKANTKYKKNLCSMCKKVPSTTVIKYKYKTFKVCENCKKEHERTMRMINKS